MQRIGEANSCSGFAIVTLTVVAAERAAAVCAREARWPANGAVVVCTWSDGSERWCAAGARGETAARRDRERRDYGEGRGCRRPASPATTGCQWIAAHSEEGWLFRTAADRRCLTGGGAAMSHGGAQPPTTASQKNDGGWVL